MTVHDPAGWFAVDEGTNPAFAGRSVGGKRGKGRDSVPGDVLVGGGDFGQRTRWAVTAVEYPHAAHVGDQVASVWSASVRPVLSLV